ncbi:MAG TPA: M15 family metallopeptidase [Mucilaginibacter sp.]|nr:M15 family metallopeptidase [Mucilaginibacter sp.]
MKTLYLSFLFASAVSCCAAQRYKYIDSTKVMGPERYAAEIKKHPEERLVEIKKYIPGIVLDIRYATTNNFTHHRMYRQARAFARLPVVLALKDVEDELKQKGLGLKIYDAYRPYAVTARFYEVTPDTNFVADPRRGSKHNRGCAVDISLVDLKTGRELNMPTGFDSFSRKAAANYPNLSAEQLSNRELLKSVMQAHGFRVISTEWWHFDFNGWTKFPLLDIPFESI